MGCDRSVAYAYSASTYLLSSSGSQCLDNQPQLLEGFGVHISWPVDQGIQLIALPSVAINGLVALRRFHKIIPFLRIAAAICQKVLEICAATVQSANPES